MGMSAKELADLEEELRAVLLGTGWTAADADEIIETASSAARQGIASLVSVAATAQEHNRDRAIILALHIMERLALASGSQIDPRRLATGEA